MQGWFLASVVFSDRFLTPKVRIIWPIFVGQSPKVHQSHRRASYHQDTWIVMIRNWSILAVWPAPWCGRKQNWGDKRKASPKPQTPNPRSYPSVPLYVAWYSPSYISLQHPNHSASSRLQEELQPNHSKNRAALLSYLPNKRCRDSGSGFRGICARFDVPSPQSPASNSLKQSRLQRRMWWDAFRACSLCHSSAAG